MRLGIAADTLGLDQPGPSASLNVYALDPRGALRDCR